MIDYRDIIKNRELRLKIINLLSFIPIKPYLKMVYWIKTGRKLNVDNPKTFCEKLNWLKINDIHPEYTDLVDKVKVREYVNSIMGRDMFFPLYGVWEHYSEIDFDSLPDKFVLKCTHDSASVNVITDKSKMNHKELEKFYEGRLKINPYNMGREYPYRNVKPRIMAEKYMVPDGERDINDYKFFCFSGEPEIMFIATDRSEDCRFDFYDMDFNHMEIENIHPNSDKAVTKPEKFEEMKAISRKLTQGFKFVRLDLYEIQGEVYFGEYTFFHGGGFWPFYPEKYEEKYGDLIKID